MEMRRWWEVEIERRRLFGHHTVPLDTAEAAARDYRHFRSLAWAGFWLSLMLAGVALALGAVLVLR